MVVVTAPMFRQALLLRHLQRKDRKFQQFRAGLIPALFLVCTKASNLAYFF